MNRELRIQGTLYILADADMHEYLRRLTYLRGRDFRRPPNISDYPRTANPRTHTLPPMLKGLDGCNDSHLIPRKL